MSRGVSSVTAHFTAAGKLSGFSGCNQYSGTYTTSGSSFRVSGSLATTQMACPKPQTLLERVYLEGADLGAQLLGLGLEADAEGPARADARDVRGPVAVARRHALDRAPYNNGKQAVVSVTAGKKLTANFDAKGNLSGFGGCNDYNATVKATPPKIALGPVASTRKACSTPDGVMDQETAYLAALATGATYQIQGSRLELRTADGAIAADFTRA